MSNAFTRPFYTFCMMMSSNGNIFRVTGPLCGEFTGLRMFSLICTRLNGWVNNGEAGDLRRHDAHYDVTVMWQCKSFTMYNMYTRKNHKNIYTIVCSWDKVNTIVTLDYYICRFHGYTLNSVRVRVRKLYLTSDSVKIYVCMSEKYL